MIAYHHTTQAQDWLRVAGLLILVLGALLALVALVLFFQSPGGVPPTLAG